MARCEELLLVLLLALVASSLVVGADVEEAEAEATSRVSYQGSQLLRVVLPQPDGQHKIRETFSDQEGVQIWNAVPVNGTSLDVLVKPSSSDSFKKFLSEEKLSYDVVIADLQEAIDKENPLMSEQDLEELEGRNGHRMEWQSYHRLADIYQFLDYLAATFPQRFSVQTIGSSVQGKALKVLKVSSGKPNSPAIWIDGGIHAREWISPASVTYLINTLAENPELLGGAAADLDWFIMPVVNPDGYEFSHTGDRLWRKNRAPAGQGSARCAGVDLNRNYGYRWGGEGASRRPCDEIYAGSRQFSEPETAALSSFVLAQPNIKASVSFHSYGQYVLYPWGYSRVVPPDHQDLKRVGDKIAAAIAANGGGNYRVGPAAATLYPAAGGSDDWAKGVAKIKYTYTIELRDNGRYGFVLPANYIKPVGNDVVAAMRVLAQEVQAL